MNRLDEEVIALKKRFYQRRIPSKLKVIRRKCEDNFGIPLSLGDRMLLRHTVTEMCMNFASSPACGGDPGKEGLAKYLIQYHNYTDLEQFRRTYDQTI